MCVLGSRTLNEYDDDNMIWWDMVGCTGSTFLPDSGFYRIADSEPDSDSESGFSCCIPIWRHMIGAVHKVCHAPDGGRGSEKV